MERRGEGPSMSSSDFRGWENGFISEGCSKTSLHRKHISERRWKFLSRLLYVGNTYVKEDINFLSTLKFPFELWWLRSGESLQLGTKSRMKVHCSEMPCNAVKSIYCADNGLQKVCVPTDVLVLIYWWARNSLKRTLQSSAWAPPSSLAPSLSLIPAAHLCRGLAFFSHGSPSWLLWQNLGMYQCNGLFISASFKKVERWHMCRWDFMFLIFFPCKERLCILTSCWDTLLFSNCLHWHFSCASNDIQLLTP